MKDMEIIEEFERMVAKYAGCKYGVAISSCTNAIFLSLEYLKYIDEIEIHDTITIPSHTFVSVPCQIKHAGLNIRFKNRRWFGIYQLEPTRIFDCATRFTKDMYVGGEALQCVSFQYKKILKLGRGGMILTNDEMAVEWLKMARINGRHPNISRHDEELEFCGWDAYMTPADAARGIELFKQIREYNEDVGGHRYYPDISKYEVFK